MLVRIAIAYFILEKKKAAPQPWQAIAQRFCSMGSYHPGHKDMHYPVNYGYIEGVMAPDGEEQDAYILGVNEPVGKFTGKIIAIVQKKMI